MARYLSVVGVEAFRERSQSVRNVHTKHGLSVDDISLSLVLSAVDEDYVAAGLKAGGRLLRGVFTIKYIHVHSFLVHTNSSTCKQ